MNEAMLPQFELHTPVGIVIPPFSTLSRRRLAAMRAAGREVTECQRVLKKGGLNLVGEVLRGQGTFYEYNHYPDGDVYDPETHAQYYYHAHRGIPGEHGHFHTFLRRKGMPPGITPAPYEGVEQRPSGEDAIAHLIAISMDSAGWPIGLFATNRWVTGETWYQAADAVRLLDRFLIDHAFPSWPVNRWISAVIRLFYPQIVALLHHRDQVLEAWAKAHPGIDVYEDRALEVTGNLAVSIDDQIRRVREAGG